jgi:hypothetical protein
LSPQVCVAQSKDISPDPEKMEDVLPPAQLAPGEKDPGLALSPMKKGQKAPFTGVLLSPSAVANVIVELKSIDERLQIEIAAATKKQTAICEKSTSDIKTKQEADRKILQADIDDKARSILAKEREIKKLRDEQTNPWAWFSVGAAGGITLTVLTAFAISKATK